MVLHYLQIEKFDGRITIYFFQTELQYNFTDEDGYMINFFKSENYRMVSDI